MANPTDSAKGPNVRFGIRAKLFLLVLIAFGILTGLVVSQIDKQAGDVADKTIEDSLNRSKTILDTRFTSRFKSIDETAANLSRDGRILPEVYAGESETLQDLTEEFAQTLEFDILMFTNEDGVIIARSDDPNAIGFPVAERSHLFGTAMNGEVTQGFMTSKGRVLQIVATPIRDNVAQDIVRGSVGIAYQLSEQLLKEIKNLTVSDVAVFTFQSAGEGKVEPVEYRSTFDGPSPLVEAFKASPDVWQAIADDKPVEREVMDLGGEIYHVVFQTLRRSDGVPLGFVAALRSRDVLMAPFNRIRQTALWTAIACLFSACLVAFLIARHISHPIISLVNVTEKIQEGSFSDDSPLDRGDEVGILYRAVYKMGRELQEKAELENYLADISDNLDELGTINEANADTFNLDTHGAIDAAAELQGELEPGTMFSDRYRIERSLGVGAMGAVYMAHDTQLDEQVALKMLRSKSMSGASLEQLKQELRLARKITHRNILRNHDFGVHEGNYFISMEFVPGFDIHKLITRKGPLDLRMGVIMARQLCSAIAAAHGEGIIHRDLKPQNMMVNRRGILKVVDFGIAVNVAEQSGDGDEEQSSAPVGTPYYMAPEQFEGKDVDRRTDIYAVGVILFFMLTAKHPFEANSFWALANQHMREAPPLLRSVMPDAPESIESIISKAMEKKREDRFQNIGEVATALSNVRFS